MNQKLMIIGAVGLVAALIIGAFGLGLVGGNSDMDMTATIYIEDEDGNRWSAETSLDDANLGESGMMALGQGIRTVQFEPLAGYTSTTAKLWQSGTSYKIWASVTCTIAGTNMKSIDNITAVFTGTAGAPMQLSGAPDHATSSADLYFGAGGKQVPVAKNSPVSPVTVSQDDSMAGNSDQFSKYKNVLGVFTDLTGDTVDGAIIHVSVTVSGTAGDGIHTKTMGTYLMISVTAWDSASLSLVITGMSGGSA